MSLCGGEAELAGYFASGGGVMWPLAGLSVWAWSLILLKGGQLASWRRTELPAEDAVAAALDGQDLQGWQGDMAREFLALRTGDSELDSKLLHRLSHRHGDAAMRGVGTIIVFAGLAPLLGLLGTVTGMIGAFDALAAWGTGNPRALSGGISEALVSTQTGLLVAIPALFAGHFLRRRAQTLHDRMERFCTALARGATQEAA
ncbi:MAG: MotA/TolQ/ExbB proton channel family protein [Desulfovibrionaceae bacterium]